MNPLNKPVTFFAAPDTLRKRTIGRGGKTREEAVRDAATHVKELAADADRGIAEAVSTPSKRSSRLVAR